MTRTPAQLLILGGLAALMFFINLGSYDLWPPDEPRYAQVAREMRDSGDYLTPRVNGQPYREKPPLLFWLMAAASVPFGDVSEWPARIPSATAGVLTVLLTWLLALRLFDKRTAFWSALVFMTIQRTWWQAHFGQIDMLLCACLTLALYAFWRWHDERRHGWLALFYAACIAAIYAKGPGVLVFPALLVGTFYWPQVWEMFRTRTLRNDQGLGKTHLITGMAVVCLLFALWVVPARLAARGELGSGVSEAMASGLFRQTLGRFFLGVSHANPPWYYFETLPVDLLPWTLFLPWTLLWAWRQRQSGAAMRLLFCWTLPPFVFFSIAIGKRAIYLFPCFPALAILIAASVLALAEADAPHWRRRTAYVWAALLALLAVAPFALLATPYRALWTPWLLPISALAAAAAIHTLLDARGNEGRRLHTRMAGWFIALALLIPTIVFPIVNQHKSARYFCAPVRALADAGEEFQLYTIGFAREEYIYYSRHFFEHRCTEILDVAGLRDLPLLHNARIQKELRHAIAKSVAEVPIADLAHVTEAEAAALREAAKHGAQKRDLDPGLAGNFEAALAQTAAGLFEEFEAGGPAFLIVQEEDWRWVLPLYPSVRETQVVYARSVGSRNVLLLANGKGAALLQ